MSGAFYFISYSRVDGEDFALNLGEQLTAGPPSIGIWLDRHRLQPSIDWDEQLVEALRACEGFLYVMTEDSVSPKSECKKEWTQALKYKKPIIPLLVHRDAELPYRLEPRQYIDFSHGFDAGLAQLRKHVRWRGTPEGVLHTLKERLEDARRDISRAEAAERPRIQEEIAELERQIEEQRLAIENPQAAQQRAEKSIRAGFERERQPVEPVSGQVVTRFINRLPMIPPVYFQNRHVETGLIGTFLKDESLRLMTVVGRGGVGKTAMVCRLLRSLEGGKLPDGGGALAVDGIVYLSARAGHPVNFPNLFADLCKLLPEDTAKGLDQLYRDAKQSTAALMRALLAAFPGGRTILLLDNFEDVVDAETQAIRERELDEALRTALEAPPHGVKFLLTTRVAPQTLLRTQPALQQSIELDEGLEPKFAIEVLRALDQDGKLKLKKAPKKRLAQAWQATRGYPRALETIVGILRADRSTNLEGLLEELQQLQPKAGDVVEVLVGEAFSRLDPTAQAAMQALAAYGAPVPAVAVDYLLQPYRVGIDSAPVLGRLVNMQFVRGEAGRYYLHQVDRDYALSRIPEGEPEDRAAEPPPFTRYALRHRAAEYFKETRKPREAWKTLDDLAPQLAEFDLRCGGQDWNTAASVLAEFDFDYLFLWGHYRLMIDRLERLRGKLTNPSLEAASTNNLGSAYSRIGNYDQALRCHEDALALAREQGDRLSEAAYLGNVGAAYADLGDHFKAIEYYEQALAIDREVGDKLGEANDRGNLAISLRRLGRMDEAIAQYEQAISLFKEIDDRPGECHFKNNLAVCYYELGEAANARALAEEAQKLARAIGYRLIETAATALLAYLKMREGRWAEAIEAYEEARTLADELNDVQFQTDTRLGLSRVLLHFGDLSRAGTVAEEAAKYNFPTSYPDVFALRGVVALRQGDRAGAQQAFTDCLAEAERLLAGKARPYGAAYTRALALAGLALCRDAGLATAAAAAYRDARAISAAPGVVAEALRDLDALAAADTAGILKPVRAAAAGEA